jgi:hypothetical protein
MMKSRRTGSAGHVAPTGQIRHASKILVAKPEGKRPFGRSRSRWEDNIKSIPRVIRLESVDLSGSVWILVASSCEHSNETSRSIEVLELL